MLLYISSTCILLNLPSYCLRLLLFYQQTQHNFINENYTIQILYRDVLTHYLSYLCYSINIIIYILFGKHFRCTLKKILFIKKNLINNSIQMKSFYTNENDTN